MTEEYKKDVLDYMTGKLTPGTQTENQFRSNETIQNNLITKLAEKGITQTLTSIFSLTSELTSNYLLYSKYTSNNKTYSWIAILNEKGEILDILTTYESGALIEPIEILSYDENGYIYGIDKPNDQSYYRIIQLNNISISIGNNYVCRLRSSYYIQDNQFKPPYDSRGKGTSCIKKIPGEAVYYILGYYGSSPTYTTKLIRFSNIVGYPVEWNYYIGSTFTNSNVEGITFEDFVINYQDQEKDLIDMYFVSGTSSTLKHDYFDGTNITSKSDITFTDYIMDIKMQNSTQGYVALAYRTSPGVNTISCYSISGNSTSQLFSYTTTDTFIGAIPTHYINITNGILFSEAVSSLGLGELICGVYYNNQFIKSQTYKYNEIFYRTGCIIQRNFDLYKFVLQTENNVVYPKIVIYDNQYSGSSYQNYNSLIPAHSEIYSNGYIQFARDLYNKQVFENQTLAVVNVPFNYLNDMTISPSNLLGQTMTTLVSDKRDITKNKYENVYINFLNKLNVIDEDINQYYPLTANYINKNINVGTSANYNISKLTKVRINFSTPQIISINWTKYYSYYKTTFEVQIEDEIPTSIDFISEDETTTYITKEYHFQKNKNYMISEKVRIGESLQREELMYNNQNVLYDNNQVMVYTKE